MSTTKLAVDGFDDRSGGELHHGYIDFTDGLRLCYAPGTRDVNELGLTHAHQPYNEAQQGREPGPKHWLLASEWVRTYLTPVPWSVEAVVIGLPQPTDEQLAAVSQFTYRPARYDGPNKELHVNLHVDAKLAAGPPMAQGAAELRKALDLLPKAPFAVTDYRVRVVDNKE